MAIRFDCPDCKRRYEVEDAHAGRTGKCGRCGSRFRIPQLPDEPVPLEVAQPPEIERPAVPTASEEASASAEVVPDPEPESETIADAEVESETSVYAEVESETFVDDEIESATFVDAEVESAEVVPEPEPEIPVHSFYAKIAGVTHKNKDGSDRQPAASAEVVPEPESEIPVHSFFSKIAGVTHKNKDGSDRQRAIACCSVGEKLRLRREPENKADRNAVAVVRCATGEQLGYISRHVAVDLAPSLDEGQRVDVTIRQITGDDPDRRGVNIELEFYTVPEGKSETNVDTEVESEAIVDAEVGVKPYGLKGDILGMSLDDFKAKYRTPFCVECGRGLVNCCPYLPIEIEEGEPPHTVAGVPTKSLMYSFVDRRLCMIIAEFDVEHTQMVYDTLAVRYGAPQSKISKALAKHEIEHNDGRQSWSWENEVSSIDLSPGKRTEPTALYFTHCELYALVQGRQARAAVNDL